MELESELPPAFPHAGPAYPVSAVRRSTFVGQLRANGWPIALAGAVIVPYGALLIGLLKSVFVLSPTAYAGLVPLLGLLLIVTRARSPGAEPRIYDRYTDYMVGVPPIVCALLLLLLFPGHESLSFWERRLDLLSLPLFAGGAIATVFGVRALWRGRGGIAFLFLALVIPLGTSFGGPLGFLDSATTSSERLALIGIKAIIGALILGLALASLAGGRSWLKALWVVTEVVVSWLLTLAATWVAIADGVSLGQGAFVHRLVELAMLAVGAGLLVLVAPIFRISFRWPKANRMMPAIVRDRAQDGPRGSGSQQSGMALVLVATAALLASLGTFSLPSYTAVLTESGAPRLQAGALARHTIAGWSLVDAGPAAWVRRYYGATASGERYQLLCSCAGGAGGAGSLPAVLVDSVTTVQNSALSPRELAFIHPSREARLISLTRVDLGSGVIGRAAVYRQPVGSDWVAVFWDWPVRDASGTRFEHVVIGASAVQPDMPGPGAAVSGVELLAMQVSDWLDGAPSKAFDPVTGRLRDGLIGLAREVISSVSGARAGGEVTG